MDVQLRRNGSRGVFMVAGAEHRPNAEAGQGRDGGRAFLPQSVGQGNVPGEHAVHRDIYHGAAMPEQRFGRRHRAGLDAVLPQQLGVSRKDALPLHLRAHAAAGEHFERLRRGQYRAGFSAAAHNGLSQRMLGELLGGRGQPVKALRIIARADAFHGGDPRRAAGQRAGLVKGNDSGLRQPFQRVALADEEAVLCTAYPYGYPLPRKNLPPDRKRLPLGPRGAERAALRLEGRPWGYFLQRQSS